MRIELEEREWQQVLAVLSQAPWQTVNGLILKIGEQMRLQTTAQPAGRPIGLGGLSDDPPRPDGRQRPS